MTITIAVAGRIATATATTQVVAGNTYPVAVSLDSEWTGNLFMRVRFGSLYYDIPFASTDTTVDVQFPVGYPEVGIGIFSEALQVCTNEVRVRLLRSILEAGEQVVEFDGDLYDQWEGEVTALLTDDAFDAESTRPVQNAVITAWKDTVALDADVVHKAGDETIAGVKTLTSNLGMSGDAPIISMASTSTASTGVRGTINVADTSTLVEISARRANNYNDLFFRCYVPDGSSYSSIDMRVYPDGHQLVMIYPYYPVDEGGNPQALTANALMASGNIPVDPRIVHTTGTETVAGTKSFTNGIHAPPWLPLKALGWTKLFEFGDATRVVFEMVAGSSIIKCFATKAGSLNVFILSSSNRPYTDCLKRAVDGDGKVSIWFDALYGSWARGAVLDIGGSSAETSTMAGINILNERIADGPTEAGGYTSIATGTPFEVVQ